MQLSIENIQSQGGVIKFTVEEHGEYPMAYNVSCIGTNKHHHTDSATNKESNEFDIIKIIDLVDEQWFNPFQMDAALNASIQSLHAKQLLKK